MTGATCRPRCHLSVNTGEGLFRLRFHQPGLLRPLDAAELSDGTLRYILLTVALFSPRLPPLLVLNEDRHRAGADAQAAQQKAAERFQPGCCGPRHRRNVGQSAPELNVGGIVSHHPTSLHRQELQAVMRTVWPRRSGWVRAGAHLRGGSRGRRCGGGLARARPRP
ncbi:AAA family ATPase [Synechococcus sp. CBW1006]|uniref:AAA family ATPase n=1 Tax=Synechococcus sp. CBW1006 TaxID=1353138 RepID=UPI001E3E3662|nr:AAA family ATPase [Synechococcus sp. CBW1006]